MGGITRPNAQGKSGIASPAPVCLIVAPTMIWTYTTAVVTAAMTGRTRSSASVPSGRSYPFYQPGDVNNAIDTDRQKTSWARPAWAIEIASGRNHRTVMPPRMPCVTTAASAR